MVFQYPYVPEGTPQPSAPLNQGALLLWIFGVLSGTFTVMDQRSSVPPWPAERAGWGPGGPGDNSYIYIYIDLHMYIYIYCKVYIYIYLERERDLHNIYIYV